MEPAELDYSCSDSDSEELGGDSDESLSEEEIVEDDTMETVLVPRITAAITLPVHAKQQAIDDDALGGLGFAEFFFSVVSSTGKEQLMQRSPRGLVVGKLLECIKQLESGNVTNIAVVLASEVHNCLLAGKKHKLPSVAQGAIYSAFHRMRTKTDIVQAWQMFLDSTIPRTNHEEHQLALQVLLDRILKKLISNKAEAAKCHANYTGRPLTLYDSNAVRYMAGYVAVKLLRKYRKGSRNDKVVLKWRLFCRVLQRMKANEQPGYPDSISSYSTLWQELIDRGGLYHVSDETFHLVEEVEMIVREYLNIPTVQTSANPSVDLFEVVHKRVLATRSVMASWERLCDDIIPWRYEKYSIELLSKVIELWVTIRGHSFAKGWNMHFEKKKQKKGTRKTLKPDQ